MTRLRLAVARALLRGTGWHVEHSESWWRIVCAYAEQRRKRRRLVERVWAKRRSNPLAIFGRDLNYWWTPERGVIVGDGYLTMAEATGVRVPDRPTIAPQGEYAPAEACVLSGEDLT